MRLHLEVNDAKQIYDRPAAAGIPILRDIAYNEREDYTEFSINYPDGYGIRIYS